jgi:hypothetical protein
VAELARAIAMTEPGQFVLLFASCGLPLQRERLATQLAELLTGEGVNLIHVSAERPEDVDDFIRFLKARLEPTAVPAAEGARIA